MDEDVSPQPRGRWPFNAGVTVALVALVLSGLQLMVTAPLFSDLFSAPDLVAVRERSDGERVAAIFTLTNEGNAPAIDVEVAVMTETGDLVICLPNYVAQKETRGSDVLFTTHVLRMDRLLPGEQMTLIVHTGNRDPDTQVLTNDMLNAMQIRHMPDISFLRSAQGMGRIERRSR